MNNQEIMTHIDHTLLKPFATGEQILALCEEALEHHAASVCIPPAFVKQAHDAFGDRLNICTVIGFPLGYHTPEVKAFEAKKAIDDGANEIDMVIAIGKAKEHDWEAVTEEIRLLKKTCGNHILKVIVETCYLDEEEKKAVCRCVTEAGADYIKTSTGFGTGGATLEDVRLFKEHIGKDVKIKAAGGIKTKEDLVAFLEAGCDRLGTSAGISLLASR